MIRKFVLFILILGLSVFNLLRADEGMWIPILLEKYNIADMQEKGFKLTAEDIYSINHASIKDAIAIFGGGCTSELISDEGLLITNHHCGLRNIQFHSSVENDYLTDGFWAMSREEELINPDLTATFLVRMEDVTDHVLVGIEEGMEEAERQKVIRKAISEIEEKTKEGTHYNVSIRPFYFGNEYYMFVYEVYKDVRLVGTPPSAIGKFGGDTDNWVWPRHTGDFSLFRIYADKDNKPAEYSPDNVPYKPKKYLPISLKGVKKGDFTMIYGYPGSTSQYITSHAVEIITKVSNPHKIRLRGKVLEIMNAAMNESQEIRIKYFAKASSVSNSWKRWQGEIKGLRRLKAIEKKQNQEEEFTTWANSNEVRKQKYGDLIKTFEKLYNELKIYTAPRDYRREAGLRIELISYVYRFYSLVNLSVDSASNEKINEEITRLKNISDSFFKDYYLPIDKKVFSTMLKMYFENVKKEFHPEIFLKLEKKYKGNFEKYADYVFKKSMFAKQEKVNSLLTDYSISLVDKIVKDPAFELLESINNVYYDKVMVRYNELNSEITNLYRTYVAGLREMQKDKIFYPDANFTLRVAYGKVDGYYPRDAVYYKYFTTLEGIMEKDNPDIYDYDVPEKLKTLYNNKDYGIYGENGKMHVCFTASNHTTGGNSGSPVINAEGHLIGINFDRCWEGTMSDIMFDPDMCRNIILDIHFVLFIIDKFAGAGYLIDEMTLVTE